jgi:hypothetical protein
VPLFSAPLSWEKTALQRQKLRGENFCNFCLCYAGSANAETIRALRKKCHGSTTVALNALGLLSHSQERSQTRRDEKFDAGQQFRFEES